MGVFTRPPEFHQLIVVGRPVAAQNAKQRAERSRQGRSTWVFWYAKANYRSKRVILHG